MFKGLISLLCLCASFLTLHAAPARWYGHLLHQRDTFEQAIKTFAIRYKECNITAIASLDAKGFVFGSALSYEMGLPLVEIDSLKWGDRVLIIEDVLATGAKAQRAVEQIEKLGAYPIEVACLIEISPLCGRKDLSVPVYALFATDK